MCHEIIGAGKCHFVPPEFYFSEKVALFVSKPSGQRDGLLSVNHGLTWSERVNVKKAKKVSLCLDVMKPGMWWLLLKSWLRSTRFEPRSIKEGRHDFYMNVN